MTDRRRYSITELEAQTGLPARTIRFYITDGLIPPAHGRGPKATYDHGHLLRLRAILLRRGEGSTLAEIKDELGDLTDDEIERMVNLQGVTVGDRWRRIALDPDLELHVRELTGAEADPRFEERVQRIIARAQEILGGTGPQA